MTVLDAPHMPTIFLETIASKVIDNKRLTEDEGLELLSLTDPHEIEAVRRLADHKRRVMIGDVIHFAETLYIHPTNLCELSCPLCSFYAKPGWKNAWFTTPEQIEEKVRAFYHRGLTEIHIVGGLWRDCDLHYYEDIFTRIKKIDPSLHIKALTPVEYDFLARLHGISVEEVLRQMISFGLGSLPGGGAEILVEQIRRKIAPGKITSDEYLHIHKIAHGLGLPSNVTMLFGHIEENEDIVTHLAKVRSLQDETKGFKTFIPLKFALENNALGKRKKDLKPKNVPLVYATSRLFLDNITHLKVLWNYVGVDEALTLLQSGGNDFSSTNLEEKIISGARGEQMKMDKETMISLIHSIGRTHRLTHTGDV